MHAMPLMIGVLACLAIAYRFYSAFLAAKVAALDDSRPTPAVTLDDGRIITPRTNGSCSGTTLPPSPGLGR